MSRSFEFEFYLYLSESFDNYPNIGGYHDAAVALERARESKDSGKFKEAEDLFNMVLDNLLSKAGYGQYNHNNFTFNGRNYIHVTANPSLIIATAKLGDKLGAASINMSEGFRTEWEHYNVVYKDEKQPKDYSLNQHGKDKAADITFYYENGQAIPAQTAYEAAMNIPEIGGIGWYPDEGYSIIHIDLRSRKPDGTPSTWRGL